MDENVFTLIYYEIERAYKYMIPPEVTIKKIKEILEREEELYGKQNV